MARGKSGSDIAVAKRGLAPTGSDSLIQVIQRRVSRSSAALAKLGDWGDHIDRAALAERVPSPGEYASGFDAGIACALDLIPRGKQRLSARLHAAYTPEAVQQVSDEAEELRADSSTCWWLAACSICTEGGVTPEIFFEQLAAFELLRKDSVARLKAAETELAAMKGRFQIRDGWAYTETDGGMQGAYLSGHRVAVSYNPTEQLYFIGTYMPSLGLEEFEFSSDTDEKGRARSGPVHGSHQYVRCSSNGELDRALQSIPRALRG